jgi:FtsH-binding integral membrane protein
MSDSPSAHEAVFGNPERVFDPTGDNASGAVLPTTAFYVLSVLSMLAGFAVMGAVSYLCRHWDGSGFWYLAVLLVVLGSMILGAAIAIYSQNWLISLVAYLGLVATPFGVLFGPIAKQAGSHALVLAIIITAVLMTLGCLIGIALPKGHYSVSVGNWLYFALLGYVLLSAVLVQLTSTNHTVLLWVSGIGIVLFFCITINDANRLKSVGHMDTDNAIDCGMQLWLNAVNELLRVIPFLAGGRS